VPFRPGTAPPPARPAGTAAPPGPAVPPRLAGARRPAIPPGRIVQSRIFVRQRLTGRALLNAPVIRLLFHEAEHAVLIAAPPVHDARIAALLVAEQKEVVTTSSISNSA